MATPTLATVGGQQFAVGYAGQIANNSNGADIESRVNENATAIEPGAAVCAGVAVAPGTVGNCRPIFNPGIVLGFAVRADSEANADSTGAFNYAQNSMVGILKDGWMWGVAGENVTAQDAVVAVVAAPTTLGSATGGAANGTTRLATQGVWQQTLTSGQTGLIHVKNT